MQNTYILLAARKSNSINMLSDNIFYGKWIILFVFDAPRAFSVTEYNIIPLPQMRYITVNIVILL